MTTSTINGKLVNPSAQAPVGAQVTFTLVDYNDQPVVGFDSTDRTETIDTATVTPAIDGTWTAQLVPNALVGLFSGQSQTAYRVVETSAGASSTYWIIVTAASPSWVGSLLTTLVGPAAAGTLPGTWCTVTDVLTYTGSNVTQVDVNLAQGMLEALIRRVWRPTDAQKRDYYWLARATAWQALYVHAHPELTTMMDVQSMSQDGISITFKQSANSIVMYSPVALRFLSDLFRGSNSTIRMNSAFQKNRITRTGSGAGSTIPWSTI